MPKPLAPGHVIHLSAYGAFGRDHCDCVRIEAVGIDWIVVRDPDATWSGPSFVAGRPALELCQRLRDEPCSRSSPCPLADETPRPPLTTA